MRHILSELGIISEIDSIRQPKGVIGKVKIKDKNYICDIKLGVKFLRRIKEPRFNVGQSVVTQQGIVLGTEAVEGTDEFITRCGKISYKTETGRKPVLIKMRKCCQINKADFPTIGLETIKNVCKQGFAGVAFEKNSVVLLDKESIIKYADENDIFLIEI